MTKIIALIARPYIRIYTGTNQDLRIDVGPLLHPIGGGCLSAKSEGDRDDRPACFFGAFLGGRESVVHYGRLLNIGGLAVTLWSKAERDAAAQKSRAIETERLGYDPLAMS